MRFINALHTLLHSCSMHYLGEKTEFSSPYFELFGVLDGTCRFLPDLAPCQKEHIFLLPPASTIYPVPEDHCILLRFSFSSASLLDALDDDVLFEKPHVFTDEHILFSNIVQYAYSALKACPADEFQMASLLIPVLGCLLHLLPPKVYSFHYNEKITQKQSLLLNRILQFVEKQYQNEISLSDAASYFDVTPQYFATFFKKFMGQTFHQYLQTYRCQKGAAYLTYTDLDLETICRKIGLNQTALLQDYAAPKTFIYETPTALGAVLSSASAEKYLSEYTITSSHTSASDNPPAIIEADVDLQTPLSAPWTNLINLGYASDFSNIRIFNQLIRTQEEIRFSYGRICRLFDLITEYTVGKRIIYDYNRIFRLLDVMIEHQMLPFIELSNKLFRIQLNLLETVPINLMKDSDIYYERLLELLPDFIRACINRYGLPCFDKWKFEISYTNYDFVETAEDFPLMKYVRYFRKIKEIIRSFSNECQIGGPGFNYWNSPQKLAEILSLFSSNKVLPDFVTAYIYPLTSDDSQASLSPDENLVAKRICALRDVTHGQYPDMEIWITEFNSNLSSRNLLNDSAYQSAFLAKTLTTAARLGIKAMGYYLLSDVPLRYVDSLDLLFGGWGLFSDKDIPKPSYHAYCLLSKLGNYVLKFQEPYLLTCNSNYSFQCLIFHYEHITSAFCKRNVNIHDFDITETLFHPSAPDFWEIRINAARPGTYLVKEYIISNEKSNLLTEWSKINYLNLSKPNDILALEACSRLVPNIRTIDVRPGQPLVFTVHTELQEVRLLQIDLNLPANIISKEVN